MGKKKISFLYKYKNKILFVGVFILYMTLLANIFASTEFPLIYDQVLNNNKEAVVVFLNDLRKTVFFKPELARAQKLFGYSIRSGVFGDESKTKKEITKMEELLKLNPNSRDVLYKLYLLYYKIGEDSKSRYFLQRARKIDSTL